MDTRIFEVLSVSCSVPFVENVEPEMLRQSFLTGDASPEMIPYISRALNEMPIELINRAVTGYDVAQRETVLKNIMTLAKKVGAEKRIAAWMNCG